MRPPAVASDRHLPAAGFTRPLSAPITVLLRDGDVGGRYASRSEAVLATALAAAGAGWTEAGWREVLADSALGEWAQVQRRRTGTRRHRERPPKPWRHGL